MLTMSNNQTSDLIPVTILAKEASQRRRGGTLSIPLAKRRFLRGLLTLWTFIVAVTLFPPAATSAQTVTPGYTSDNSDWWSYTRRSDVDEGKSQNREPAASNFQILGLKLDDDEIFSKATTKLGKAPIVERGDASTGRSQICYSSPAKQGKIYLVFEKGEVNEAFYMFSGGPDWQGSDLCTKSNLITKNLSVASGLHIGQTPAEVRGVLGKPSVETGNKLIYSLGVQKKSTAADFKNLKPRYPDLSEEELHRNYEFYTLGVYIEARFRNGNLTYLAVSETEAY